MFPEALNTVVGINAWLNMGNYLIFVVISVLVVMLIYSSSSPVLAESPRDICTGILVDSASKCNCNYYENQKTGARITSCCTKTLDGKDLCKVCDVGPPPQGEYSNCHTFNNPTKGLANPPQGGVIEQPSTPKKHAGTVPQDNGGGVIEQPQSSKHSPKENTKLPTGSLVR